MEWLVAIFVIVFGCIIGSFLNVLILRYHTGRSAAGRSGCLSCGVQLTYLDLFPLVSYIALRARCRACGVRIAMQYPLVELLTALLFFGTYLLQLSLVETFIVFLYMSIVVFIIVYDLRHTIIPDICVYTLAFLGLVLHVLLAYPQTFTDWVWVFAAGPVVAAPLYALWLFSRGKAMGFGDVKLALAIGWLLGVSGGFAALYIAFVTGAISGLYVLYGLPYVRYGIRHTRGKPRLRTITRYITMRSEIPFGPFLIFGLLLAFFFSIDMTTLLFIAI